MRDRLHAQAGIFPTPKPSIRTLADLEKTQWSPYFEQLMRNRLIMGAMRYGILGSKSKPLYNMVASMETRLSSYKETGNLELLVDIANLCLVEFIEGKHPKRHWQPEDDGTHCQVK